MGQTTDQETESVKASIINANNKIAILKTDIETLQNDLAKKQEELKKWQKIHTENSRYL